MFSTNAMEGRQGDQRFWTTSVRWGELDHVLVFPDELGELDEDQRMQRGLAKGRLGALVQYLEEAADHFFSALTLVILPRDFSRPALEADEETNGDWDFKWARSEHPAPSHQSPGVLWLSGGVRLFPADGQHRAKAAMTAIRDDPRLAKEAVPVVLVPYQAPDQVRQLFSDLNLNAKPASKTMGYDFETRDPMALIAKQVAVDVALFRERVNRISNSLPKSSSNVITLNTLVQGSRHIAEALADQAYPDDDTAMTRFVRDRSAAAREVAAVWDVIVDSFTSEWEPMVDGDKAAGDIREEFLFAHGLGWLGLAQAAAKLIEEHGEDWEDYFRKAVVNFDWRRSASVWRGNAVLKNEETGNLRVNNTGPAVQDLATKVVNAANRS